MEAVFSEADLPEEQDAIRQRARAYVLVRLAFDAVFLPLSFLLDQGQGQVAAMWFVVADVVVLLLYWLLVRRLPALSTYLALLVPALLIVLYDVNTGSVLLFTWLLLLPLSIAGGLIMGRTGFNSLVTLSYVVLVGGFAAYIVRAQWSVIFDLPQSFFIALAIALGIVVLLLNTLVETLVVHMFQQESKLMHTKAQLYQALAELEDSRLAMRSVQQRMLRSERLTTISQVAAQLNKSIQEPLRRLQIMLDEEGEAAWSRKTVRQIRQDLRDIVSVIEGLQHIAELRMPVFQPVNLDELVIEYLAQLPPSDQSVHIQFKEAVLIPPIQADPQQVRLLLHHLLENALQVTPAGGEVTVSLQPAPEGVWLSVRDTGPGIPADQLEKIFEPLFSTQKSGIGLGLVICQQIAQLHGGIIRAENLEAGGARFSVYFPKVPHNFEQEFVQDVSG